MAAPASGIERSGSRAHWRPRAGDNDAWDPRKASILTDPERDTSLGHLGREQIMLILTLQRIVVEYADDHEDAWDRAPNIMKFLDECNALSASLFGKGREQVVEVLRHDEPKTPAPEYVVPREQSESDGSGETRGF